MLIDGIANVKTAVLRCNRLMKSLVEGNKLEIPCMFVLTPVKRTAKGVFQDPRLVHNMMSVSWRSITAL